MQVARRRRAERFYACGALALPRAARSTRTLDIMMTPRAKALVMVEVLICFGPVSVLLILGLLIVLVSLVMDPSHAAGNLDGLAMVIGGILGLIGLGALLRTVFSGKPPRMSRRVILVFTALGMASLLPLVIGSVDILWWRLIGLLPMLAAAHLIYLARANLFGVRPGDGALTP